MGHFGYYSQIVSHSFLTIHEKETKQRNIRDNLLEAHGFDPSFSRQLENEAKEDGYIRKFNLYPNPSASNDNLKIELESLERISATVTIVNTLGQQVYLRNFTLDAANNNIIVPTSDFAPGNYIVTVTDGVSQRITKPLIIQ